MSNKAKIVTSNFLIIFGILCELSGFVMLFVARDQVFGIISMFVSGIVGFIVGGILWKKADHTVVVNPPIQQEKPKEVSKPKKRKRKKSKKQFISKKEWDELEEEEDEMIFFGEIIDDD